MIGFNIITAKVIDGMTDAKAYTHFASSKDPEPSLVWPHDNTTATRMAGR